MQAVRFHSSVGPEVLVLEGVPRPQVGADKVLIRAHAAGVNPIPSHTCPSQIVLPVGA